MHVIIFFIGGPFSKCDFSLRINMKYQLKNTEKVVYFSLNIEMNVGSVKIWVLNLDLKAYTKYSKVQKRQHAAYSICQFTLK